MNKNETKAPVRAFDRAYINGKFVTPHGTQVVELVNPTNNTVIGKVTMADEIDTRQAIAAAKEAFNTFSQSSKEYRMDCLQRLHDAVAKRMDQLVDATVLEYGAPQDRAKGSNNLAANIFLHFKEVLKDFDLARTVGTSKVVMEPAGVVVRIHAGIDRDRLRTEQEISPAIGDAPSRSLCAGFASSCGIDPLS